MDIRYALHPDHFKTLDTTAIRQQMLIEKLFSDNRIHTCYSHIDRIIIGGVCPAGDVLKLEETTGLGVDFFLQRREIGIINVGQPGIVIAAGKEHPLDTKDALYVGMGCRELAFRSADPDRPAKFYFASTPAHAPCPTVRLSTQEAQKIELGAGATSNQRTIYQLIHPSVLQSCQLVMGFTELAPGSVWNTMPCHTHDRRMEAYFYFELPDDALVFHLLGQPDETRHIVMRNEQAVLSPSWSIHSGVGTSRYSFIWAMAGENQTFTDMDDVPLGHMK
jgi:4-deoxy-L-threo-5-hexosulose-uronate ketol-isomerase